MCRIESYFCELHRNFASDSSKAVSAEAFERKTKSRQIEFLPRSTLFLSFHVDFQSINGRFFQNRFLLRGQNAFFSLLPLKTIFAMASTQFYIMFILYLFADYFDNITNFLKISFYPLFRCAIVMIFCYVKYEEISSSYFSFFLFCQRREISNSIFIILQISFFVVNFLYFFMNFFFIFYFSKALNLQKCFELFRTHILYFFFLCPKAFLHIFDILRCFEGMKSYFEGGLIF